MHSIQIHKFFALIIPCLYLIGVWHRGDKPSAKEMRIKLFYSIQHALFVLSLAFGAIENDMKYQSIFLADVSVGAGVVTVKLWLLIWKQNQILDLTNDVESFFSNIFFIQFGTSGLCICNSVYCLAFNIGDDSLERLIYFLVFFYFISDLFMITYFGNEIMLSSNRLSHCLFDSDWCIQPQSTKKCIVIFGEYLKQPQQLVIGKLYPLTLETFTRILNSAYSMFNILKSFQ